MDIVFIKELQLEAVIGCLDWEREVTQQLLLDLELETDCKKISATDDINMAINYAELSERVQAYVAGTSFQLIETLAQNIAELIQNEFGVQKLTLTLYKPGAVPTAKTVGVRLKLGA
jgi:dihydroneopterin aldolase